MIPLLSGLFPALADVAARGALLLAVGLLLRRIVPGHRPGARHVLLATILVGLLALPALTLATPWRVRLLPAGSPAMGELRALVTKAEVERPVRRFPTEGPRGTVPGDGPDGRGVQRVTAGEPGATVREDAGAASGLVAYSRAGAVLVWAAGALALLGRLVLGLLLLARRRRGATPMLGPPWSERLEAAKTRSGLRAPVRLYRGSAFRAPVVWGWWRPVVLLPEDSVRWSEARAEAVLLHELAHLQRRDWLWMLVGRIARDLHWFDPFAWWAWRRMCGDAEAACDLGAVRAGVGRTAYARHLVEIARSGRDEPVPALPLTTADVERRVSNVLEAPLTGRRRLAGTAITAAAALGILVAGLAPHARAAPPESPAGAALAAEDRRDGPPEDRRHAGAAGAASVGPEDIVDALVAALSDPSPPVRRSAMNALRDLGAVESRRDVLARLLSDSVEDVRIAAAVVLGLREPSPNPSFPPGRIVEPDPARVRALMADLGDPDFRVRLRAANGLSNLHARSAVEALADRLSDPDFRVRQAAANALGAIGDSGAVPGLRRAYGDESPRVRQAVASSLGDIGAWGGAATLVSALRDPDEHVRRAAAESLGEVGVELPGAPGREATDEPGAGAGETEPSGSEATPICTPPADAAGGGLGSDLAAEVEILLEDRDGDRRERAAWRIALRTSPVTDSGADPPEAEAAGKGSPKGFHHALVAALYDPDEDVRLAAVCSLGRVGGPAALEHLARRARDVDPGMVAAVEWTRARIRDRTAVATP